MGAVDSFSWKQVAVSAISAGATTGISNALPLEAAGSNFLHDVARGAISYGTSYAANKLVSQPTSFSWASLAASSVGIALGTQVGSAIAQEFNVDFETSFGSQFASELTGGVADLHIGRALG